MKKNEMENFSRDKDGNLTIILNGERIFLKKSMVDSLTSYLNGWVALKVGDVVYRLVEIAKDCRLSCAEKINKSPHMNDMNGEFNASQEEIDAVITHFINFVAAQDWVDLALYTKDLREPKITE